MNYQALLISLSSLCMIFHIVPIIFFSMKCDVTTLSLYFWLTLQLLQSIINASIWGGSNYEHVWNGRIYCDILSYLNSATLTGIVCSIFAFSLRSYSILKGTKMCQFSLKKRNLINAAICWICPVVQMGLIYLVMSWRYVIAKYDGCVTVDASSWLNLFLNSFFPFAWCLATMIMSCLTFFEYYKKRFDAEDFVLCSSNNTCSLQQIWRTLIFCLICVLFEIPITLVYVLNNSVLSDLDYDYHQVHSKVYWNAIYYFYHSSPFYSRWIYIALSFLSSILIGIGSEIVAMYLQILSKIGFKSLVKKYQDHKEEKLLKKLAQEDTPSNGRSPMSDDLIYTCSDESIDEEKGYIRELPDAHMRGLNLYSY